MPLAFTREQAALVDEAIRRIGDATVDEDLVNRLEAAFGERFPRTFGDVPRTVEAPELDDDGLDPAGRELADRLASTDCDRGLCVGYAAQRHDPRVAALIRYYLPDWRPT